MISIQNVSKLYRLYRRPLDRALDALHLGTSKGTDFWALRNVNLQIDKGEVFAVVGPNGSGKSTLLQIVSGILKPTTGRVLCQGRIAALLELGAGFNPEFTGRENVYLNGEILGHGRAAMAKMFPRIEKFADIGQFIDRPVKEYSSGMYVRLAFSTAIHVDPDILIVDEALAVGDAVFSARCVQKFDELRERGVTVLLVSHDLGLVKRLADRAAMMLDGGVVAEGTPKDVVNRYVGYVLDRERVALSGGEKKTQPAGATTSFRHGDGASRIQDVAMLNSFGEPCGAFGRDETMTIRIVATFEQAVSNPVVGILIRNRIGVDVFGTNTRLEQIELGHFEAGETLEVQFEVDCLLSRGEYTLTVATQHWSGLSQDWLDEAMAFTVIDHKDVAGVLNLNTRITHKRMRSTARSEALTKSS